MEENEVNITYSPDEILKILPHRHPFLMVDRIVECNGKDRIVGVKCIAMNEPCFQGHFPGKPVFPGVLQLEAMAQTAGVLLNVLSGSEGQLAVYLGVDTAKFRRQVVPGDVMRMECTVLRARMGMYRVAGRTFVDGDLACEAEMLFGRGR